MLIDFSTFNFLQKNYLRIDKLKSSSSLHATQLIQHSRIKLFAMIATPFTCIFMYTLRSEQIKYS